MRLTIKNPCQPVFLFKVIAFDWDCWKRKFLVKKVYVEFRFHLAVAVIILTCSKVDGNLRWIFFKKILLWDFWAKRGRNWTQNDIFKLYQKSTHETFLIFTWSYTNMKIYNSLKLFFYCQKFCFEVFRPKGVQNGPKMKLFKFYEKINKTFLIFLHKVTGSINTWNFLDLFSLKKSCAGVLGCLSRIELKLSFVSFNICSMHWTFPILF